ncbi:MAG: ADP-ribosylglycohydrolase family protein [Planctomycetota bacterium]
MTNTTSQYTLRDRVRGMLIGSAIGDALGAPVEFWDRAEIAKVFRGEVEMRASDRPAEAEGIWLADAPSGTTTDDTRWKRVLIDALGRAPSLTGRGWCAHLMKLDRAMHDGGPDRAQALVGAHDSPSLPMDWLEEWLRVARAYLAGDPGRYARATALFYGGDLACAGMMYSPVLGALHAGDPAAAYQHATELGVFDMGFARDISALTAAMTARACVAGASLGDVLGVIGGESAIDPEGFAQCRLLGRIAADLVAKAREIVEGAWGASPDDPDAQTRQAYDALDRLKRHIGFHAGEIHLVNLSAMLFSDGDFESAMRFVVNYGRDNDTTAAVTGAILGAMHGADALPQRWVAPVLEQNRAMGMDLVALADALAGLAVCG